MYSSSIAKPRCFCVCGLLLWGLFVVFIVCGICSIVPGLLLGYELFSLYSVASLAISGVAACMTKLLSDPNSDNPVIVDNLTNSDQKKYLDDESKKNMEISQKKRQHKYENNLMTNEIIMDKDEEISVKPMGVNNIRITKDNTTNDS